MITFSVSPFHGHFPGGPWVKLSRYQSVSILDIIEGKAGGGGGKNWN